MKTAIFIPDAVFKAADRLASELKVSRSQLYTQAIQELLAARKEKDIEKSLNAVHGSEKSGVDPVLSALQARVFARVEW